MNKFTAFVLGVFIAVVSLISGGVMGYDSGNRDATTFERERQARFCHVEIEELSEDH